MSADFRTFDSATVEIARGVNLVEASAGTGKTYAIAMLVLRAVVELAVPIDRILIVTFTKAATEELRGRIRTRLVDARNILAGDCDQASADGPLLAWAAGIANREAAVILLRLALADIDRAAIFTIHGFCQRMLVEQALESGQLFEVELLTDIEHVRREVAEDFWRSHIYKLPPVPCTLVTVTHGFSSPEKLLASVTLACKDCPLEPPAGSLETVLSRLETALVGLTAWWRAESGGFIERCRASIDRGHFKKAIGDDCALWFQALDDFFAGRTQVMPEAVRHLQRSHLMGELNGQKVRGEEKKLAYFADWTLPDALVDGLLASAEELILTLRLLLAEKLRAEVARRLEARGTMGFDDLILRLAKALEGERGEALKAMLGARFSVALIDEFQDTDTSQWAIFAGVFGGGDHFLYLIGDPKQAIYRFRGADIHSYFQAKEQADNLLTLERNFRSHPALVAEVNRLFSSRARPFCFPEETLGYRPVRAARDEKDADIVRGGKSLAGMVYCSLPPAPEEKDRNGRWSSSAAAEKILGFVVAEILLLLDPAAPITLGEGQRPLAPRDIAVLARSNRQAEDYRRALAQAGVPAVLSSRESVFRTDECRELMLVLQAIASPGEMVKLKTALAVSWFGMTGNELHGLWRDEERFGAVQRRFYDYHRLWQEEGFLPMMSRLLAAEEVLVKLAAARMAERAIANIHHLLELIQEEETAANLGMGEVFRWLDRMMAGDRGSENGELLLESDEEAVRIVTMHGAKGLEFPVVFCPFLWYRSNRLRNERYQISCHDGQHRPLVDLGSGRFAERREEALAEEMAEDLRLLYVALTRARSRCYTMWADVRPHGSVADSFQSALGYLLFSEGTLPPPAQEERLRALVREHRVRLVQIGGIDVPQLSLRNRKRRELRPLAPSGRSLFTDWQLSSFSALALQSEHGGEALPAAASASGRALPFPELPAGAGFGNVMHDLLQTFPFAALARQELDPEAVRQKCGRFGVSLNPADAAGILKMVVETPLVAKTGDSFTLAELDESRCLKEMAFYYRLGRTATEKINAALATEPTVVPVNQRTMQGYLTGFIDLVCEYGGRFYILDYKTNFLGPYLADYRPDNLTAAMQAHNYGLQYWLYTLVLHRHLENVLPDYTYRDHFGGVFYLFMRGMDPEIPGSGVFATLPDYRTLLALDLATGGQGDE